MKQLIVTILVCSGFYSIAQQDSIYIIGAMKDVMWKGDLKGRILLDSISPKLHAYGLGPLENLKGEIMLLDGKCFVSKYETDSTVAVIEDCNVKAPFFGYTNISSWSKSNIPDSVCNISQIDAFLETTVAKNNQPFFFQLETEITEASIHIMDLPNGIKVTSPQMAHEHGQKHYLMKNKKVILLGFFSTNHQTIFTHHDTYTHMHIITDDYKMMGHLEDIKIKKGTAKLLLPQF